MSKTDKLLRLLDERGMEYELDAHGVPQWRVDGSTAYVHEMGVGLGCALTIYPITPEQAIAATLGLCSCTNDCTNGERTETCHTVYLVEVSDELLESRFPFAVFLHRGAAEDCAEALRGKDDGVLCFARVSELKVVDE